MLSERVVEWTEEWKQEGLKQGLGRGREKGRKEGFLEGQRDVALGMIKKGYTVDVISQLTDLSEEEIEALIKETT